MTLRRAGVALCALCVLAGCGHRQDELTVAVQRSPYSYFHYADAVWWGGPVRVSIRATAVEGSQGGAIVEVRRSGRLLARQDVLLRRGRGWHVVRTILHVNSDVRYCGGLDGIEKFFHSCLIDDFSVFAAPYVEGPRATRDARPAERAAIVALVGNRRGDTSCIRFDVRVSSVDGRYAVVTYRFVPPFRSTCSPANGLTIVSRTGSAGWRIVGEGSDEFPCAWGAPGVMRSLLGICVFGPDVR